jgi:hypothetical protein
MKDCTVKKALEMRMKKRAPLRVAVPWADPSNEWKEPMQINAITIVIMILT